MKTPLIKLLFLTTFLSLLTPNSSYAQLIPDNTLGTENSIVKQLEALKQQIEGGAIRGQNLFHSFLEFNVGEGQSVYFANPNGIDNILTRVTGNNLSHILGELGVNGNANLFLINPNGFIFGANSQLNLNGSFLASTADSIIMSDGTNFSATNPQPVPLLTVSVPLGVQFNTITHQGGVSTEALPLHGTITHQGQLTTIPQQTIALVGSNVTIDNGTIIAEGGRIEIGAVGANSFVGITTSESGLLALDYTFANEFQDISLIGASLIDAGGNKGGEIQIQGNNLNLQDSSLITSSNYGIEEGGEILLNATETISLTGDARITTESRGEGKAGDIIINSNQLSLFDLGVIVSASHSQGNGGNIFINTGLLEVTGDARITTESRGEGKAGDIIINSNLLSLFDVGVIVSASHSQGNGGNIFINTGLLEVSGFGIFTETNSEDNNALGNAGNININAVQVAVTDGANINSATYGEGNGGNIQITASEGILLTGFFDDGESVFPSGIFAQTFSSGNGGDININTSGLVIENGALIDTSTFSTGNAGNIIIDADIIALVNNDNDVTGILAQTAKNPFAFGNAGNITIDTQQLYLFGGAQISSASRNGSEGGNINITANESILVSGTSPTATLVSGQSGIFVSAEPATLDDSGEVTISPGGNSGYLLINTSNLIVEQGAKISADTFGLGKGGNVLLNVNKLEVLDGGLIRSGSLVEENAPTLERGNSGTLTINATESVTVSGIGNVGEAIVNSSLVTETQGIGGDAGLLTINTPQLSMSNQAIITASTSGQNANANRILIDNAQSVTLDNSRILSLVDERAIGNSGEIIINTNNLTLENFSLILTSTSGTGNAGAITIETGTLTLNDGSLISANTEGIGDAGLIDIKANESITLSGDNNFGFVNAITTEVGEGGKGDSGGIKINTGVLTINDGGLISAGLSGEGKAGAIAITATDSITIQGEDSQGFGGGIASEVKPTGKGNSDKIIIDTGSLTLLDGAKISASTFGQGNAGVIDITATDSILISGEDSQGLISGIGSEVLKGAKGDSGGIIIKTDSLTIDEGGLISAGLSGEGNAGVIDITATDSILISGEDSQGLISAIGSEVVEGAKGNSGGIVIDTSNLTIDKGALISASTTGEGNAGLININATDSVTISGEDSQGITGRIASEVGENAKGNSEGININTATLTINEGALISASTRAEGNAGQIIINANDIELKGKDTQGFGSGISSQVEETARGDGGGIIIDTSSLSISDGGAISTVTSGNGNAGKIEIKADSVLLSGKDDNNLVSRLVSEVDERGIGNSNEINITTTTLELNQGAAISASTFGEGNAGNINIIATDYISLSGTSFNEDVNREVGGIFAITFTNKNAGNINLDTGKLTISEGSGIETFTEGEGNAGDININTRESIILDSDTKLIVETRNQGKAGNITIDSPTLTIGNNAELSAKSTDSATGENAIAGDITLNVNQLNIAGELGIFAETNSEANAGNLTIQPYQTSANLNIQFIDNGFISARTTNSGDGGSININASENIDIRGIGSITAETSGNGKAGNINLTSGNITIADGTIINTSTESTGNAGLITFNATESIFLTNQAQIISEVKQGAIGDSQGILINTPQLTIADNSQISAATQGEGKAGNIEILAESNVTITNNSLLNVETDSIGEAGNINISTDILTIGEDSELSAKTTINATGKAGNINIFANFLDIQGELGIFAETDGIADAGNLNINPQDNPNLTVTFVDEGQISASTTNSGNGGNININAPNTINLQGEGIIRVETLGSGKAGNILINGENLNLSNGLEINASTQSTGDAGNINLSGNQINISETKINAFTDGLGDAGSININYQGENSNRINLTNNSQISTEIRNNGVATQPSNINLKTDNLTIENSTITTSTSGKGNAGNITIIDSKQIDLNNGKIIATASREGNTGEINLSTNNRLNLINNSEISSSIETGGRGNSLSVNLSTPELNLNNSQINAFTDGLGDAGSININYQGGNSNRINLTNNSQISTEIRDNGIATQTSNINLKTDNLTIENSTITTSTSGKRNAGNITIIDSKQIDLNNGKIIATASGEGNTGEINLSANNRLNLNNNSEISSSIETGGRGNSLSVNLSTPELNLNNSQINAFTDGLGDAGSININYQGGNSNRINLTNNSQISTEIRDNGIATQPSNINLKTDNLTIENSIITASTSGKGNAGNITIPNSQNIYLDGGIINAFSQGKGNAGTIAINNENQLTLDNNSLISTAILEDGKANQPANININSETLTLNRGAEITASNAGSGEGGNIIINVKNPLILNNQAKITSTLAETGTGKGGDIIITSPSLFLDNQSQINASNAGKGDETQGGGFVQLIIEDTISLNNQSEIATAVEATGTGIGGVIQIDTQNLNLANESQLRASTLGQGTADSIIINADTVSLTQGSKIRTETSSNFQAGNISLNLTDILFISDSDSGLFANTEANSTGDGGNITIKAPLVNLTNQGVIAVNSLGSGKGGEITIQTNQLNLDNSNITTQTVSSDGGDLTINIRDLLTLSNSSNITATAGTAQSGGDGGNIIINAPFIISYPSNPLNAITANAFEGNGGNIDITTNGIFSAESLTISASSQLGLDGEVIIRNPNVDPTSGLINIDVNFVDAESLISQNACKYIGKNELAGSFLILGKGGLPLQPNEFDSSNLILIPWVNLDTETEENSTSNLNLLADKKINLTLFIPFNCQ